MEPRHILLLTDRDWTHPQGGGTGTNLYGQVSRWIAWGHRVTVVAGAPPLPAPRERAAAARTAAATALDGLELLQIEYGQAVRDGRVIAPTEYQAAKADVQRV